MSSLSLVDMASRLMAKKGFISKATSNSHGQFRAKAEKAGETTRQFAKEHEHSPGKLGKQARLAETLMGLDKRRGSVLYDKGK